MQAHEFLLDYASDGQLLVLQVINQNQKLIKTYSQNQNLKKQFFCLTNYLELSQNQYVLINQNQTVDTPQETTNKNRTYCSFYKSVHHLRACTLFCYVILFFSSVTSELWQYMYKTDYEINHIKKRLSVDHHRHLKPLKIMTLALSQLIRIQL